MKLLARYADDGTGVRIDLLNIETEERLHTVDVLTPGTPLMQHAKEWATLNGHGIVETDFSSLISAIHEEGKSIWEREGGNLCIGHLSGAALIPQFNGHE